MPDQRTTTVAAGVGSSWKDKSAGDDADLRSTAPARAVGSALTRNLISTLPNAGRHAVDLGRLHPLRIGETAWESPLRQPSHVTAPFVLQGRTRAQAADSPGRAAHA